MKGPVLHQSSSTVAVHHIMDSVFLYGTVLTAIAVDYQYKGYLINLSLALVGKY